MSNQDAQIASIFKSSLLAQRPLDGNGRASRFGLVHPDLSFFLFGNGPNTVSESTVSNPELSEFFGPHRVPGRELSEFLSACYVCQSELAEFFAELTELTVKLSEWSSPTQHTRNSIPPVSHFCLFGTFPIFRDVPRCFRGFPVLSFSSFSAHESTYKTHCRKGPRHNQDLPRKKWETLWLGNPPGLASLN